MKNFLLTICTLFCQLALHSQSYSYANEWIQYEQQYIKFPVTSDGIYRISFEDLQSGLLLIDADISTIDPHHFQLFRNGEEQFIFIEGEEDGVFHSADFIEFYALKNDGVFDAQLYEDPVNQQSHTYHSMFTDTSYYFLTWNSSIENKRYESLENDISDIPAVEPYCVFESRKVFGSPFDFLQFCSGPPYAEVYSSKYETGEGFQGYKYAEVTLPISINTSDLYTGTAFPPTLNTVLIATNEVTHSYQLKLNEVVLADTTFDGFALLRYQINVENLVENNTLYFTSSGGLSDWLQYPFVTIQYPRNYSFDFASTIKLKIKDGASSESYLELTDFDEKSTLPILYDFSEHKRIIAQVEDFNSKFYIPYGASGNEIYVSSQDASDIKSITTFYPVAFIDFSAIENQGTYLIISHPSFYDDGSGINWVEEYGNYRSSLVGGGYQTKFFDINQLYDQFAYGIQKHPLAIRNFSLFAKDFFVEDPRYLLLIGRAFYYDYARVAGSYENGLNVIPTFGNPGSDNLLVSRPGSVTPEISIGRISAITPDDIRKYYNKVIQYEAAQADPIQTIENKAWMKKVLHFAGGLDSYEQVLFNTFLTQYGFIIKDTLFGAEVLQFNKTTTDPILYSTSDYIDSIINSGVSLMTFFGHASSGSFDYNVGDPENFENTGKYHMVFSNGCNTSAIFGYEPTISEHFVFAEDKGAIAFIASTTFSLAGGLYAYGLRFYDELADLSYPFGIGDIVKETNDSLDEISSVYDRLVLEHTLLLGDPALKLNTHEKPDYVIEPSMIFFDPPLISTATDSFQLNIVVTNIGRALDTTYFIEVVRHKPDGTNEVLINQYPATYWRDTIKIKMFTDAIAGVGLNSFDIHIDYVNDIDEPDELNNIIQANTFIISNDAIPIYPVEFAIQNHIPEYLAASTADLFATEKQFIVEIDTTKLFNSALRTSTIIFESGGVINWPNPSIPWIDSTVYYWRVSLDTLYENDLLWRSSSFIYKTGVETGWNQSHYFQYLQDAFTNIVLPTSREFEFVTSEKTVEVATGIYPTTDWTEVTSYIDGELIALGSCASAGFVVFVFDPATGDPWTTYEVGTTNFGPYGDVYCSGDASKKYIQFNTNDITNRNSMYAFMMSEIPDSAYFICYSNNYAEFNEWMDDEATLGYSLFDAFTNYGATEILSLETFDVERSYIFGAKKGNPSTKFEIISDAFGNKIEGTFAIKGFWNSGNINSTIVGPAQTWDKVKWKFSTNDSLATDVNSISIYGITVTDEIFLLANNLISTDTTIAWIDANQFPRIQLKVNTTDDTLRTPTQIEYLRVIYSPVPEAALNPNILYTLNQDTLQQGDEIKLSIAVTNVSDYNMDSLLIAFHLIDRNHILHPIPYLRQDSLLSNETLINALQFETTNYPSGLNTLFIEVNPNEDQPEQYHFNNLGYIQIYNEADIADPLMDVTFDGVHIFDGDLVSAEPFIMIQMDDENQFLPLTDTALLEINLKYPDGTLRSMQYNDIELKFYPALESNLKEQNTARVEMIPGKLQDGIYDLIIHGKDASGNVSGNAIDYTISFEVINKPMISNVFNYPNPFTTQTRFVFTLTGSDIPEYFKIQIMTITGKVIREIQKAELGNLHIGNNITEFAWDGTDAFGDQVANGLYLYRVVTKLNGQNIEKYETQTDQFFQNGWGKMYLAR